MKPPLESPRTILHADADARFTEELSGALEGTGAELQAADSLRMVRKLLERPEYLPRAFVSELLFPDGDAFRVLLAMSARLPVAKVICSRHLSSVRATELEGAGFVVVPKPAASSDILHVLDLSSPEACSARPTSIPPMRTQCGPIEVDLYEQRAYSNGTPLPLSPLRVRLLACLVLNRGGLVTHEKIVAEVFGTRPADVGATIRVHVAALREALGARRAMLRTIRGRGYSLSA